MLKSFIYLAAFCSLIPTIPAQDPTNCRIFWTAIVGTCLTVDDCRAVSGANYGQYACSSGKICCVPNPVPTVKPVIPNAPDQPNLTPPNPPPMPAQPDYPQYPNVKPPPMPPQPDYPPMPAYPKPPETPAVPPVPPVPSAPVLAPPSIPGPAKSKRVLI